MDYQSQYLEQVMNEIIFDKNQLLPNLERYYRDLIGDSKSISPMIYKILAYLAIYKIMLSLSPNLRHLFAIFELATTDNLVTKYTSY